MARPKNLNGGRPPKYDRPMGVRVGVLLTESQHARIAQAAEAAGKPVGEWIRETALAAAGEP